MVQEYNALLTNRTWDLIPPNPTKKLASCKWVFRVKENFDESIERYKTRLVAQCLKQQSETDYGNTFNPIIKPVTIRLILSHALSSNWSLRQLDVKNVFPHGHLDDEVDMLQQTGFRRLDFPDHICRLRKALYGLK